MEGYPAPCQDMEKSLKVQEHAESPGIHYPGLTELGLLVSRIPDSSFQLCQDFGYTVRIR